MTRRSCSSWLTARCAFVFSLIYYCLISFVMLIMPTDSAQVHTHTRTRTRTQAQVQRVVRVKSKRCSWEKQQQHCMIFNNLTAATWTRTVLPLCLCCQPPSECPTVRPSDSLNLRLKHMLCFVSSINVNFSLSW